MIKYIVFLPLALLNFLISTQNLCSKEDYLVWRIDMRLIIHIFETNYLFTTVIIFKNTYKSISPLRLKNMLTETYTKMSSSTLPSIMLTFIEIQTEPFSSDLR
jgi:hypothetical protein